MIQQQTIGRETQLYGIGIHSGKNVNMSLLPAEVDTGVVFVVHDNEIKATFDNVSSTNMSTTLTNNHCKIDVVEHFMAALWGTGIDNIVVVLNANELPIFDGSAYPFVNTIMSSGIIKQSSARKILHVKQEVAVTEGDKYIKLIPHKNVCKCNNITIDMTIDFAHPTIGRQHMLYDSKSNSFIDEISNARTFGFISDLEMLHKNGLGLGASLGNCIAIDENGLMNEEGLRFNDEFVRHKILDCIGDLFLSGYNISCDVIGYKTGHKLNNLALHKLFADPNNYIIV